MGGVKVGIVDTGVMAEHEDLAGRIAECAGVRSTGFSDPAVPADPTIEPGLCADDNGHGTMVAGILGARADNASGVTGVAFNTPLAVCKAMGWVYGSGTVAAISNCITHLARTGSRIISMSIGGLAASTTWGCPGSTCSSASAASASRRHSLARDAASREQLDGRSDEAPRRVRALRFEHEVAELLILVSGGGQRAFQPTSAPSCP